MKFSILCLLLLFAFGLGAQAQDDNPQYQISVRHDDTDLGTITLELFPKVAPLHVRNFDSLVSIGFYNGTTFHRVLPGSLIQGGDPNTKNGARDTWGFGDPSQRTIPAEFSDLKHVRGILSAARRLNDDNSATSQFFIMQSSRTDLDGRFTIYGQVLEGMEVVDAIAEFAHDAKNILLDKVVMTVLKVGPTDVDDNVESSAGTAIRIGPNPCNGTADLRFELRQSTKVQLGIYNSLGHKIAELLNSRLAAGAHTVAFDASAIAAGVYHCRLILDGEYSRSAQLLVLH